MAKTSGTSETKNSKKSLGEAKKADARKDSTKTAANGFPAGTDWAYTDLVKEHFLNPRNFLMGDESKYQRDGEGIVGNPICGDQMLMMIQVEEKDTEELKIAGDNKKAGKKVGRKDTKKVPVIKDVKWKTYGCASAIASTSALSELAKGRTLDAALKISAEEIEEYLGGLPKHKFHCSVLGHEALVAAIADYQAKQH